MVASYSRSYIIRHVVFARTALNNNNDVRGIVITTIAIARAHPVHLMNVDSSNPHIEPTDLGCDSAARLVSSASAIAIRYYY